uniref:Uncharacterized protein n=1 Tax=Sinocyclocheilus rhinocerous TaxID=307959 RepID=A0A673GAS9_9TELE
IIAESSGLDFVLSLGDHFYFSGVRDIDDTRFKVNARLSQLCDSSPPKFLGQQGMDFSLEEKQRFKVKKSKLWICFLQTCSFSFYKTLIDVLELCGLLVWIIVMFFSAVWTLILTAPIHCRGSICEQFIREDDGSSYVVSGTGVNAEIYTDHKNSFPSSWQLFSNAVNQTTGAFVYFEVNTSEMLINYIQEDGKCVYQTSVPKRKVQLLTSL